MLKFFARTIDDILPFNPLVLFKKGQQVKLAKMFERGATGFRESASEGMRGYFGGKQYGGNAGLGTSARAATTRKWAAGIGGGLLAANYLGINPLGVTDAATDLASLAGHGILGGAMIKGGGLSKGLGIGYLGLAGLNTFRAGDNRGPM